MPDDLCVPHLSYDQIRQEAKSFLSKCHPSGSIPVPIEEIVEIRYRLDIVPTPGLLENYEVDAFITSDMESIYIDEFVYQSRRGRYKFSLAHELAHAVLHQKTFRKLSFDSIEGWKSSRLRIPEDQYAWLEWQAYAFAGLVLVPEEPLKAAMVAAQARAHAKGFSLADASEPTRRMVAGAISQDFDVSTEVVEKRIAKDGIWPTCAIGGTTKNAVECLPRP